MFDAAYYINLDRSPHRRDRFLANVAAVDWPFPKPERWPGVVETPPSWFIAEPGAWGCLRAHLSLLEHCILQGIESVMIFEDDAVFPEDLGDRVRAFVDGVPDDWNVLYFGGHHFALPEPFNDKCLLCRETNMTVSYAVRGAARASPLYLLARFWRQLKGQQVHIDRIWGTLQEARRIRAYCPWDWITGQAAGVSDRNGEEWQEQWFHLRPELKDRLRKELQEQC